MAVSEGYALAKHNMHTCAPLKDTTPLCLQLRVALHLMQAWCLLLERGCAQQKQQCPHLAKLCWWRSLLTSTPAKSVSP